MMREDMKRKLRKSLVLFVILGSLVVENTIGIMASVETENQNAEENKASAVEEPTTGENTAEEAEAPKAELPTIKLDDSAASREEAIVSILSGNPEDAGAPNTVKPTVKHTSYTQDVSFPETTLHGIFSSTEVFFEIPDYWEAEYVYAEIQYDVSQLVQSIASSMTFSVNNVPIDSCRVSYKDGDAQVVYVEIPMELIKEDFNSLAVSAYARLYDEEGCIDDFSGANWLTISEDSYIRCGYEIKPHNYKIGYYPYPFMSTVEDTGKGLAIVVSDQATNGEVAAAMNLMADLSTATGKENEILFGLLSDLQSMGANRTIIVSNYNNLPAEYKSLVRETDQLDTAGVVTFTDDKAGNPLLLVVSNDDDCLTEAAYMLMDEDRADQEKSDVAIVKKGSADVAINSTAVSQMVAGNYTIADIIGSGMTFAGPFHQEQLIYLPFSEDYFLSDAGKVTLKFRYSDNLDFTRSLVTVYWGDIPVASKRLTADSAKGDELIFTMPADVVGTTAGSIKIAFDLEIQDLVCTPRQEQMPWAYVSEESILYLPASTGIVLTFDLKPSPFRTDGKFNDLMLVLSDNPTTEELNLYAQIIGMYGEGVNPYGTFFVKRSSEFSSLDADYNIITVGTYAENKLLQNLNEKLYFPYESGGTRFASNEKLILSDTYAGDIAILQLLESPYASNRGILAVTGIDQDTLSVVSDFMRIREKRYSLSKDCVLVDSEFDTKAYQFISTLAEEQEPTIMGNLTQNKQSLIFTIVATSVMLMLLIAVILVLIRIKLYHRNKED